MVGARPASIPTTRTSGPDPARAAAIPETSPPPPTGTTTVVASGASSASSSPMVPWPAMISGSSKGGTNTASPSRHVLALAMQSSTAWPLRRTVARSSGRLDRQGRVDGMKMVAGCPVSLAARATPWAWLPADPATTGVPGGSREIRL